MYFFPLGIILNVLKFGSYLDRERPILVSLLDNLPKMKETKPRNRLSYMSFVSFVACGGFSVSMFHFKETWKHFKIIHSCMHCFSSIAHKKDALKCKFSYYYHK